jgi:hypothetical protein
MLIVPVSAGFALVAVAGFTAPHPSQPSSACKLLQVAEIEAAVGGKASGKASGERQSVPGMTVDVCTVEIPSPTRKAVHRVELKVITDLPMDGGEAVRIRNRGTAGEQQWKVSGARLAQETVGTAICILTSRPGVAGSTTCSIPRGKGFVEVSVAGSLDEMASIPTVRALVQKAFSRL